MLYVRFEEVTLVDPFNKQALFNLASIMHMIDLPTLAVGYVTRLLVIDPEDSTAHSFLWALNRTGQCVQSTLNAYTHLSALGDIRAITKLAVITGSGSQASKGDPTYAEQIYDEMAGKFESKLVDHLGYKGPWLMLDQLEKLLSRAKVGGEEVEHGADVRNLVDIQCDSTTATSSTPLECDMLCLREKGTWRILDIGCGSGLVGKVFADYAGARLAAAGDGTEVIRPGILLSEVCITPGPMVVGIDVSVRMTEITEATGHYDCAHHADVTLALALLDCTSSSALIGMDMVVAADTFIYVGALGEVFSYVRKVLRNHASAPSVSVKTGSDGDSYSGGLFMFTTEDLDSSPMLVSTKKPSDTPNSTATSTNASACSSGFTASHDVSNDVDKVSDSVSVVKVAHEIPGAVPGWGARLLTSARFAHSDSYIRQLCVMHGFRVLCREKIVLRTEETVPLPGNIYILQKID